MVVVFKILGSDDEDSAVSLLKKTAITITRMRESKTFKAKLKFFTST